MGEWIRKTLYPLSIIPKLGRTETLFLSFLLGQWSLDDVLPNVIFLSKVEKFADLRSTLGTQSLRHSNVSQARDFLIKQFISIIGILAIIR